MATTTTTTNKPLNPRAQDLSPKGYNRAALYSGKALDFDGVNDFANVVYSDTIGSVWTWSSIIEADALSGYQAIFGGTYGANNGLIVLKNNQLNIYTNTDNLFSYILETGKKYHVALSQSGSSVSAFINGVLVDSVSLSTTLNAGGGSYYISRNPSLAIEFFNGQIAGVKLFNTALTPAQVADLYLNPEKIVPDGVADSALKLWLPMMEGAGTTAYDGSGNGNHGIISGATWVSGVGAPVAQTALVSWNKGTNLLLQSNIFSNAFWTNYQYVTQNSVISPSGAQDGSTFTVTSGQTFLGQNPTLTPFTPYTLSIYAKKGNWDIFRIGNGSSSTNAAWFDLTNGTTGNQIGGTSEIQALANGWYRCSYTTSNPNTGGTFSFFANLSDAMGSTSAPANGSTMYFYSAQVEAADSLGAYIPNHTGTPITSPVLLPQGLTANKDITGVNAFESARNPYALNLDGASWGEVHDNASLDVSEITAEGWMYTESITTTNNRIVNKWDVAYPERSFQLYGQSNTINWMLGDGSAAYSITGGTLTQGEWYHVVGTYDGTTQKIYLNGVQVATTALSITLKQSSFKVMLGGYAAGLYSLNPIALPRIYNRALTATEVARNYNADKSKFGL